MNPDELAELEEQRQFLVRSLDDLDREVGAGDLDPLDAATLRDDYTHRLAEVQRAIETGRAALARPTADRPRRRGRVVAGVVVVAALAVGAGFAVAQASGSRRPGDTLTGNIRETTTSRLRQAALLQDRGEFLDALKLYDEVIEGDPANAEALAERGFLLLKLSMGRDEAGFVRDGLRYVDRAVALEPTNPRWLFYRAVGLRLAGDDDAADAAFEEALANDPPAALRADLEALRASFQE